MQKMNDLSNYRKSYEKNKLLEHQIPKNPIDLFGIWFSQAEKLGTTEEVNAMNISTLGLDGFPKNRIVLLKKFSGQGFSFYTNYESEKGKAILTNPKVCLSFFWQSMERQVIIKGIAEKTTEEDSDSYFACRPIGSKLGAMLSPQSKVIPSREFMEKQLELLEQEFENIEIPRPKNWGGFLVRPISIEFWQGRTNRLHDRIRYQQKSNIWKIERLAP